MCRLIAISIACSFCRPAAAALRPGAARSLRLTGTDAESTTPNARWHSDDAQEMTAMSLTQPVFAPRAGDDELSFFFTRRAGNTRNLWRAALPTRSENRADLDGTEKRRKRGEVLGAVALTRFVAPYFAEGAAPTPDGRFLLFLTNAFADGADIAAGRNSIARLDLRNGQIANLTGNDARYSSLAVAPDGARAAYISDRGGLESIYFLSLLGNRRTPDVRRVVSFARHPFWLDATTLVYESTRPGSAGLYRVAFDDGVSAPQLLWQRGGQGAASADGTKLCVSSTNRTRGSQLFMLAADGSGARAVAGTDGASAPSISPDGTAILFEAPANEKSTPQFGRTLWLLPMLHVLPTAILSEARALRLPAPAYGLEIRGTIFSQGDAAPRVSLAWGETPQDEGAEPSRWNEIPVERAPVNNGRLALWTPPSARGEWTLRLSVTDSDGDSALTFLPVTLPLEDVKDPTARIFGTPPPGTNPSPGMPLNPPVVPLPILPPPALPPRPAAPTAAPIPPAAPVRRTEPPRPTPRPVPRPVPRVQPEPAPAPSPKTLAKLRGDAAVVTISGVPVSMTAGEQAPLVASLRNIGSNGWKVSGDSPIRLLVRWHDMATGTRTRWAVRWLRADVPPGGLTKISFSLVAPPRPGRYALKFSLVRAGKNGYEAPPFTSPTMPGEFGVASTTMDVQGTTER